MFLLFEERLGVINDTGEHWPKLVSIKILYGTINKNAVLVIF